MQKLHILQYGIHSEVVPFDLIMGKPTLIKIANT